MGTVWKIITRKKLIDPGTVEETRLSRVLNTFDLTALGVGSTLGVGVYVVAGQVAKETAGPSVVLSFLIAAVASVFAGLCYAEFGARAPRAGSAYIYSYVCVGELIAFIIGWNLILEYVIGSASVAKGLSVYLDTLLNGTLQNAFIDVAPINIPFLSTYFDFFAFGISFLLSVALAFGMKESKWANNIFTTLNIGVVIFTIIAGSLQADPANWNIDPNNVTNATHVGDGGFFPFGIEGTIKGAATCFYGFVGFDCIATTGEEVKNPKKAIPIAIILSLFISFLAYFGTSTVVTLMVPYYLQDADTPIPYAFEHVGWYTAKWIVAIGAIFGLFASLFGALFPLPRIIYAMASDGLVFRFLGRVNSRFQTPVVGTLLAGAFTGLMGAVFDLKHLVNMMSIGTLLAYTIVAASVLLLRFTSEESQQRRYNPVQATSDSDDSESYIDNRIVFDPNDMNSEQDDLIESSRSGGIFCQLFNCGRSENPTKVSELIVTVEVFIYCVTCILMGLSAIYLRDSIFNGEIWAITLTSVLVFIAVIIIISMVTQPTSKKELTFKVPLVPLVPALSILANVYLMLMLDKDTWIRFAVWMAIGLPTYYFSVRPAAAAQNPNVSGKNSVASILTNYHNNLTFVSDENGVQNIKKKKAPRQPIIAKPDDKIEIDSEVPEAIKRLDRVLDEAESRQLNCCPGDSSLSRVSVAVVHCHNDNIASPSEPENPPLPLAVAKTIDGECEPDESVRVETLVSSSEELKNSKAGAAETFPLSLKTIENEYKPDENFQHETFTDLNKDTDENHGLISNENNEMLPVSPLAVIKTIKNGYKPDESLQDETFIECFSDLNKNTDENREISLNENNKNVPVSLDGTKTIENEYKPDESVEDETLTSSSGDFINEKSVLNEDLTDANLKMTSLDADNETVEDAPVIIAPPPPPMPARTPPPSPSTESPCSSPVSTRSLLSMPRTPTDEFYALRPTSEALKSIRLKSFDSLTEDKSVDSEDFEPDDSNLQVGSDRFNFFKEKLNEKLKKNIAPVPFIMPFTSIKNRNLESENKEEKVPNENVIEESIDQKKAKEKLVEHISNKYSNFPEQYDDSLNKDEAFNKEKSLDFEIIDQKEEASRNNHETSENKESEFLIHKKRMAHVFRSINLKNLESSNGDLRRASKSLGAAVLNDDKIKYRQAMGEIFKDIKSRRKDSQKIIEDKDLKQTETQ